MGRNEEFEHTIDYGPAKGLRMPVRLPDDKGFWKGTYEEGFCSLLAAAVKHGDVCHDIGAFRGYTAGVMALAGASEVESLRTGSAQPTSRAARDGFESGPTDQARGRQPSARKEGTIKITIHEDSSMNFIGEDSSGRPASGQVKMVVLDALVESTAAIQPRRSFSKSMWREPRLPFCAEPPKSCAIRCARFSWNFITPRGQAGVRAVVD